MFYVFYIIVGGVFSLAGINIGKKRRKIKKSIMDNKVGLRVLNTWMYMLLCLHILS